MAHQTVTLTPDNATLLNYGFFSEEEEDSGRGKDYTSSVRSVSLKVAQKEVCRLRFFMTWQSK